MTLSIAKGLALPDAYVTQTTAILAQRRSGKTYTASTIAEELGRIQAPFVVLDPTGAWWGLRSSADGEKRGMPVVILGGEHGDVPLEDAGGKVVADLVIDHPSYYVLDLSGWESRSAEVRFARDFAERLFRRKANQRDPLHVIIDEAEVFAPQRTGPEEARMLGAFEAIVKRGGIRGIGTTLISQRAASLNKNVLEQVDRLILLRTVGPNDRKAVDSYVSAYATPAEREELMGSLASLELGEAWVYEPGAGVLQRVRIRERRTFNSSATPKHGEQRVEPRVLAPVDLDALREKMAATIEKAQADDPKTLRTEIARLRKQLAAVPAPQTETVVEREVVEVHVVDTDALNAAAKVLMEAIEAVHEMQSQIASHTLLMLDTIGEANRMINAALDLPHATIGPRPTPTAPPRREPTVAVSRPHRALLVTATGSLPKAERSILSVLAQFPEGRSKKQVAMLSGYSAKGGGFGNALSRLRSNELITRGDPMRATDAGLAELGEWEPLPTGPALLEHWMRQLGRAERMILQALVDAWPRPLTKEEIADATDYSAAGGGFGNALSRLRTLELIGRGSPIELDETLAEAIR